MQHYLQQQKGNVIVTVVVTVIILLIASIAVVAIIKQQTLLVSKERYRSQAFSVAEAGLEKAIWLIEREKIAESEFEDDNEYTFAGSNSQGTYSVTISRNEYNDFQYNALSTGNYTAGKANETKKVSQDLYYLNLSKSVFSYGSVNGGGAITGNVEIQGPFYCGGDFVITGTTTVKNQTGVTGNPLLVRGNLDIQSASAQIGGNTQEVGPESPMAVFVKGDLITKKSGQVYDLISREVPEITLPPVVPSRYLAAAEANDFAVYNGDIVLGSTDIQFGGRGDGSYTFDYDGSSGNLLIEGVVYIDGSLTVSNEVTYDHPTGYTQATIYTNGQIFINNDIYCAGDYPTGSVLALINPDISGVDEDIKVQFASHPKVYAFIYTAGKIKIYRQIDIHGSVMAKEIVFEQVPSIYIPTTIGDNYPYLFPGKEIAFVAASKWREVP